MRALPQLLALATLSLLGACSILPKAAPQQFYLLPSQPAPASQAPALQRSLRIDTPQASQVLASNSIAVVPEGNRISQYAASRWSDSAPRLLRNHLLSAFQADGRFPALSSDDDNLQADLLLDSQLLAFQSEYRDGTPQVVVRLQALLVDGHSQRILASRRFEARQTPADAQVPAVVSAFGQASDRLAAELLQWTLQQAAAQPKNQ